MKRKFIIAGLVIGGIAIAGLIAYAALSANWPFTTAGNYTVYKGDTTQDAGNADIIVADGVAKLVQEAVLVKDDTIAEYNTGYDAGATVDKYVSTAAGPDASLVLTKTGSTYI